MTKKVYVLVISDGNFSCENLTMLLGSIKTLL
jgi:hypothetical protein